MLVNNTQAGVGPFSFCHDGNGTHLINDITIILNANFLRMQSILIFSAMQNGGSLSSKFLMMQECLQDNDDTGNRSRNTRELF